MGSVPAERWRPRAPADVGAAAQLACLLEASAPKPGNVSPGRHFHDTRYEDFLASAAAIGPVIALAGERGLGATVLAAVEATRRWTRANTNLGIVLLIAPLARAVLASEDARGGQCDGQHDGEHARGAPPNNDDSVNGAGRRIESSPSGPESRRQSPVTAEPLGALEWLRAGVARVLAATSVADAADLYAAIRLARPAGLGRVSAEDVREAPRVTLRAAMALAAEWDGVAREYATDFATTFGVGAPALARARASGLPWDDAVVETYLALLAAAPDTHVARKLGPEAAAEVTRRALRVVEAGGVRTAAGRRRLAGLDRALRDERNANNPGTTADLTAASIFAHLLDGGWRAQEESGHGHPHA